MTDERFAAALGALEAECFNNDGCKQDYEAARADVIALYEAKVRELEQLRKYHEGGRANVEYHANGLRICTGMHESSAPCGWDEYVPLARAEAAERLHAELLYAVAKKFPDESRHETALRYIRNAEKGDDRAAMAAGGQ